ncbi:NfeD family protein [Clostridium rectalis]|uniref:NfeD family protein n=1 Tax=Clostridium rectalis TaxID=2040295 RepID=UPI000F62F4AB|nr:NfeD family protein [Clostridium rectalis]
MEATWEIILWVSIGVIALVVDILTSSLLFVWFTIGAIAALITLILGYKIATQLIIFIIISIIFMVIGYPLAKKTLKKSVERLPTMEEGYIGRELIIEEEFSKKTMIKVDGIYWTVKSEGEPIKKGDKVKITRIDGNRLIVKKV